MRPAHRLSVLMLLAALLAGCSVFGSSIATDEVDVTVITGDADLSEREMRTAAARELRSFVETGRKADLADAAYAVEQALLRVGHAHARVEFVEAQPGALATLNVTPGPVAQLGSVTFSGDSAFPDDRLLPFFLEVEKGLFSSNVTRYSRSLVDEALSDVERLHLLEGYRDVRVGPAEVTWSADLSVASVRVPIERGPKTLLRRIRITGIRAPDLRARVRDAMPRDGAPYHARLPAEVAAQARRVLLEEGHQAQDVDATVSTAEDGGAEITLAVTPGPVFRVRDIGVLGAERSRPSFIVSRLAIAPGDVARQSLLDRSTSDLYGTGIFRRIDTRFDPPSGSAADRTGSPESASVLDTDLLLAVAELPARSVEAEGGWGSYEQTRGRVRYTDRNLFGTGRILDATLAASLKSARFNVRIEDRYLLGARNVLTADTGYRVRTEPTFEEREANFEAAVRRDLGRGLSIRGGYLLRISEASNIDGTVRGAESSGFESSAGPFATLSRDTRDDRLFPTSGGVGEVGIFWSAPPLGAALDYIEWRAAYAKYIELREGTVLALGTRLTTRDERSGEDTLPVQERLFLGGEQSVRSFLESELGPTNQAGDPLGGLTSVQANVELRQRLSGSLEGALFYDVGNLSRHAWHLSRRSGQALGIGLRYRLPVGPMRLDFGWNPGGDRFAAERDWALHFSFGFSF